MLSYLGQTWGRGAPRLTPERIVSTTRDILERRGAVTWDVPVERNGVIAEPFIAQLQALKRALAEPTSPADAAGTAAPIQRAQWLRQARWGVMGHYLADWIWSAEAKARQLSPADRQRLETSEGWNALVDGFDVTGLADQLAALRVPYFIMTVGQGSGFYAAPSKAYDEITGIQPSRCSRRDLIAELAEALESRGIRLLVYSPGGPPGQDERATQAFGFSFSPQPARAAALKWQRVVREWSERWGRRVHGWWFDGFHWPNIRHRSSEPPSYASFAAAARAGNPDAIVAFNSGLTVPIVSVTPHEDYTAGVTADPAAALRSPGRVVDGRVDGAQLHMVSYIGETWGSGPPREIPEQIAAWTRKMSLAGGAATWDVPLERNGRIAEPFVEHLRALARLSPAP